MTTTIKQLTYNEFLNKVFDMYRDYVKVNISSAGFKSSFFEKFEILHTFDQSTELEFNNNHTIEIFKSDVHSIEFKESSDAGKAPNTLTVKLLHSTITFQYA